MEFENAREALSYALLLSNEKNKAKKWRRK